MVNPSDPLLSGPDLSAERKHAGTEREDSLDETIIAPGHTADSDTDAADAGPDVRVSQSTSPPSSPRILGQYELLELLGQGGMGSVYKARHTNLDKLVAVKLMSSAVQPTPHAVMRFKREMKAVGRLDHPNIVRAMDAGEINGTHYLAMELVDGIDLSQKVRSHGPLSIPDACQAIHQVAVGLYAAHSAGLIHRDLKPSNLLQASDGQIKILDLGLARLSENPPSPSQELTASGLVLGTPDYMAPEQWQETQTVGEHSDLYALGCTLFYLLIGRAPYATEQYQSVTGKMFAHSSAPIPDIAALRPDIPPEVRMICERLLAKQPGRRFANAAELALALEPFLTMNESHQISMPPVPQRSNANLLTHPSKADFTSPGASPGASTATYQSEKPKTLTVEKNPDHRGRIWIAALIGMTATIAIVALLISQRKPHVSNASIDIPIGGSVEVVEQPDQSASP